MRSNRAGVTGTARVFTLFSTCFGSPLLRRNNPAPAPNPALSFLAVVDREDQEQEGEVDGSDRIFYSMTRTIKASLLFFFLSLCGAAIFVTDYIRPQVPPPAPHELFAVVEKQLAAVRAADYPSAYRHAASGVQQKFTVPQFEAMIRRDYADMTNAQRIEFGFVKVIGSAAVVQVYFVDESSSVRSFLYSLIAEGDSWKINGVQHMQTVPAGHRSAGLHI